MTAENLATRFELERPRLQAVATRILGSRSDADDAVQESWLRLQRANVGEIANLGAWLTVVVSRIALDHVRTRVQRREIPIDAPAVYALPSSEPSAEATVIVDESVYEALAHALDQLSPLELAAFILHDLFRVPFDEISTMLDRSPDASRKLASRARGKITASDVRPPAPAPSQRAIIDAFLEAARGGDMDRLVSLLAPNVTLRADEATIELGAQPEMAGVDAVANRFSGWAQAAFPVWIDGAPGAAWIHRGDVRVAFDFVIRDGLIEQIWLRSNPDFFATTEIETEPAPTRRNAGA
ncbi:MAG: sigma-70 family RNA polymerase sigma factor [Thermomicrobiales bacterium]|nr:sigma-70 family RNA polymerase sigma factor [Thermomicrobiales bacterium]